MILYLLACTAVFTLILNILLTLHLIKEKFISYSSELYKREVVSFVLKPNMQNESAAETEVLMTEVLLTEDS